MCWPAASGQHQPITLAHAARRLGDLLACTEKQQAIFKLRALKRPVDPR
jgi:hypothetical protein